VIYGTDRANRPLAVWVSDKVEGHAYLDEGVSRSEAAEKVKLLGYDTADKSPLLINPAHPHWAVMVKISETYSAPVLIDKQSGEVTKPTTP
jgi:uncharacterized protein YpmB